MDNEKRIKLLKQYLQEAENLLNNNLCGDDELIEHLKQKVEFERNALKKALKRKC